ncbi:MAG: hypothetical protein ACKPGH_07170, partial [Dolichospermum sp.]
MSSSTKTVVFIDPSVQDYQNQVKTGTLLFLIKGKQNGIQQINQNLSGLKKTEWSLTLGSYPSLSSEVSTVPASPKSQVVFPTLDISNPSMKTEGKLLQNIGESVD